MKKGFWSMGNDFGQLLRELRIEAKLTQKQLGDKIHIDGSTISRFGWQDKSTPGS